MPAVLLDDNGSAIGVNQAWQEAGLPDPATTDHLPRLTAMPLEAGGRLLVQTLPEPRPEKIMRMAGRMARVAGWEVDLRAGRLIWSEELYRLHELPPGDSITLEKGLTFYLPEYREMVVKAGDDCVAGTAPLDFEAELITARGRRMWVHVVGEAVSDSQGEVIGMRGAMQDVSNRKKLESSLLVSEGRFQQMAESLALMVWSAGPDGEVDYLNRHFFDYTGLDPGDYILSTWPESLFPEDREPALEAWQRSQDLVSPFQVEHRICRKDGAYRWFRVQALPFCSARGEVIKWYGTALDIHDLKELEQQATHFAERLRTTLESLTDGFMMLDHDWRVTYVNAQTEMLFQKTREELVGQNLWKHFPQARTSCFARGYEQALAQNRPVTVEEYSTVLRRWLEVRSYPSSEGLAVYIRDVGERVASREALRTSEERFQFLSKATKDAIWDWDLVHGTLWWSESFEVLFGIQRAQVALGIDSWMQRVHPQDLKLIQRDLQKAIEGNENSWVSEYRFARQDGSWAQVLDRGYIIRDEGGKATRMIGSMTDLTEHKQAEARIHEQAALIDQARDAIIVRDLQQRITFWSKGAERIYGRIAEEALGQYADQMLQPEPEMFAKADREVRKKGEWVGEIHKRARDGQRVTLAARWTLLNCSGGNPRAIMSIDTDVTQARSLEQQFLRAQRMESIGTLAGGIAHDLNNVLAPIIMSVEYLRAAFTDPEDLEVIEMMAASAQRGADMVRQVLTFARGVEGQRMEVQLTTLLKEIEQFTRDTFPKQVEIQLKLPESLPGVIGDPTQLHQVLVNLCVNARDAMPGGGHLCLAADPVELQEHETLTPGSYVRIRVDDTGSGIPAEILEKIYDPFFTTKAVGKGTGLGLSTTMAIVKGHGGFLQVTSEVGAGTRFQVFLPSAASGPSEIHDSGERKAEIPRGNGELILVVDDEQGIRQAARRTLEAHGYRVLLAADGAEAVETFTTHHGQVAVVLTDLMMPVLDGLATVSRLQQIQPDLPIIAASGLGSSDQEQELARRGVTCFLAKPYGARVLLQAVRNLLD
ncbi:hypothetical protein ABS71_14490 [bacterium SCN 62-11]|nr:MAG: hypothetical protein ABS71_14490 [bacterium SCN 62-11]